MAKPSTLPEWDTTEVNSTEPDATHQSQGWLAPGGVPEKPPFQTFNHWMNASYKWFKELNQQGVVEWDGATTYQIGDISKGSDGRLYSSLIGSNTNNDPLPNLDKWRDMEWRKQTTTHNISSDADYTLTTTQNRYGRVVIADTGVVLTAARNIIVDNIEKDFIVQNDTLQDITVKTVAGSGILIPTNEFLNLYNDGVNIIGNGVVVTTTSEARVGTNNTSVITPLRMHQSNFGLNQTWQDVLASRAAGVNYTNSTGRPIMISVSSSGADSRIEFTVGGVGPIARNGTFNNTDFQYSSATITVPNGAVYLVTSLDAINHWHELS